MAIIRVYAHHSLPPAASAPPSSLTVGYPGWPPPTPQGPLPWPSAAGSAGPLVVWCEIAKEADVLAASYVGPNWGPPPFFPDEFFSTGALGFLVSRIRIVSPNGEPPGTSDHQYTFRDPSGAAVAVLTPVFGNPATFIAQVAVADGRGIWTIEIRRIAGSSVATPGLLVGPGPVDEPFVAMYAPDVEGTLRIEFEGQEILVPPCPSAVTVTAELETSAGSGQYQPFSPGACVHPGRQVRFTASVTPPGISGLQYDFDFGDGTSTGFTPANMATHVYTQSSASVKCEVMVWLSNSVCPPKKAHITFVVDCCPVLGQPDQYWDSAQQRCVNCTTGLTVAVLTPSGCGPGSVGVVSVTATPPPGMPPAASYTWTIDGPMHLPSASQIHVMRPTPGPSADTSSGWSGTGATGAGVVVFNAAGIYSVSVSVQLAGAASKCRLQAATSFACTSCPPGQHWDPIQGQCVVTSTTTPTRTSTPTPSCSIWCIIPAFLLIALPISAFISTAAHCLALAQSGFTAGLIAAAIGLYLRLCGACCLWLFILIGAVLGVVATLIYAYWAGFPACLFSHGLPLLFGFVALGFGLKSECERPK